MDHFALLVDLVARSVQKKNTCLLAQLFGESSDTVEKDEIKDSLIRLFAEIDKLNDINNKNDSLNTSHNTCLLLNYSFVLFLVVFNLILVWFLKNTNYNLSPPTTSQPIRQVTHDLVTTEPIQVVDD